MRPPAIGMETRQGRSHRPFRNARECVKPVFRYSGDRTGGRGAGLWHGVDQRRNLRRIRAHPDRGRGGQALWLDATAGGRFTVSGSGFSPETAISLVGFVVNNTSPNPLTGAPTGITADASGDFSATWDVPAWVARACWPGRKTPPRPRSTDRERARFHGPACLRFVADEHHAGCSVRCRRERRPACIATGQL